MGLGTQTHAQLGPKQSGPRDISFQLNNRILNFQLTLLIKISLVL